MGKPSVPGEVRKSSKHATQGVIDTLKEKFDAAKGPIELSDFSKPCRLEASDDVGRLDLVFKESGSKVRVLQGLTPEDVSELREFGSLDAYNRAKAPQVYVPPSR